MEKKEIEINDKESVEIPLKEKSIKKEKKSSDTESFNKLTSNID